MDAPPHATFPPRRRFRLTLGVMMALVLAVGGVSGLDRVQGPGPEGGGSRDPEGPG